MDYIKEKLLAEKDMNIAKIRSIQAANAEIDHKLYLLDHPEEKPSPMSHVPEKVMEDMMKQVMESLAPLKST